MQRCCLVLAALLVAACAEAGVTTPSGTAEGAGTPMGSEADAPSAGAAAEPVSPQSPADEAGCADVVDARAERSADGTYTIHATVRSHDTGWEKYADEWRVEAPDGTVLGVRELAHPHVDEQPFTRSLRGIEIPASVGTVVLRARDSVAGRCGATVELAIGE